MSYLIDTNVLSELRRKSPDPGVLAWFSQRPPTALHLSALTLGEIRKGIEGVDDERRRQSLIDWLQTDLPTFFTGRILSVDGQSPTAGAGWLQRRGDRCRPSTACSPPPRWNTIWYWSPATSKTSPACPSRSSTPGRTDQTLRTSGTGGKASHPDHPTAGCCHAHISRAPFPCPAERRPGGVGQHHPHRNHPWACRPTRNR